MDKIAQKRYPVTVVVPIYCVEEFIERCVVSLFEQNFDDIEYIFVDDASPDNSVAILQDVITRYPQRSEHIQIIHNAENLGLFETRKIGVMAAKGEYIQHIDSDDWVEVDMISSMYSVAKKENADVVTCDFYIEEATGTRYRAQKHLGDSQRLFTAFLQGWIGPNVWSRLIKRDIHLDLYRDLNLHNKRINLAEDWLITLPLYCLGLKIIGTSHAHYHYNKLNQMSLTENVSVTLADEQMYVLRFLLDFLQIRLSNDECQWLRERFSLATLNIAFQMQQKPNFTQLQVYGCNDLSNLWCNRCAKLPHKSIHSFYFLHMPWVPKIIQKIRLRAKALRKLRVKK